MPARLGVANTSLPLLLKLVGFSPGHGLRPNLRASSMSQISSYSLVLTRSMSLSVRGLSWSALRYSRHSIRKRSVRSGDGISDTSKGLPHEMDDAAAAPGELCAWKFPAKLLIRKEPIIFLEIREEHVEMRSQDPFIQGRELLALLNGFAKQRAFLGQVFNFLVVDHGHEPSCEPEGLMGS